MTYCTGSCRCHHHPSDSQALCCVDFPTMVSSCLPVCLLQPCVVESSLPWQVWYCLQTGQSPTQKARTACGKSVLERRSGSSWTFSCECLRRLPPGPPQRADGEEPALALPFQPGLTASSTCQGAAESWGWHRRTASSTRRTCPYAR